MAEKKGIRGILKSIGEVFSSVFGIDKLKNSLDENGVLDSTNEIFKTFGVSKKDGSGLISTKKEKEKKEKAEAEAAEAEKLRCLESTAKSMGEMAESIKELTEIIKNK